MPDLSAFIFYTVAAPLFFGAVGLVADYLCKLAERNDR